MKLQTLGVLAGLSMLISPVFAEDKAATDQTCIKSGSAYTSTMNWNQRKELFVQGTITDCEDKVWDILIIPGTDKSKNMTVRAIERSADRVVKHTTHLVDGQTYSRMGDNIAEMFSDTAEFSGDGFVRMKEGVIDHAIIDSSERIFVKSFNDWGRGFSNAGAVASDGNFSWLPMTIFEGFIKPLSLTAWNITVGVTKDIVWYGGGKFVVGAIQATLGGIGMVVTPILSPGYELVVRPLWGLAASVVDTVVVGGITSGTIYVWNGTAWTLSQLNDVPKRESTIGGLRMVDLRFDPNDPRNLPKITDVSFDTFSSMIQAQVKNTELKKLQDPLSAEMEAKDKEARALRAKAKELDNEYYELRDQKRANERAYEKDPVVEASAKVIRSARRADEINIEDGVKLVVKDMSALNELVMETAAEMGTTLSAQEAEAITAEIVKTFTSNLKMEMETETVQVQ